jgi:hypothetical protein
MSSSDDDYKGLEKATIKCDACNLPTHAFIKVEYPDAQGKFVDERWCPACSLRQGEEMRDSKEQSR